MVSEEVLRWVLENGGSSSVEIAEDSYGGRRLVVCRDVPENEVIVHVPSDLVFSTDKMPGPLTKIAAALPEDVVERSESVDLLLYIVYERVAEKSFWAPYLDSTPKDIAPVLLSAHSDRALEGTPLLPLAQQMRAEVYETFEKLIAWLTEHLDVFRWAQNISESRAFRILSGDTQKTVLVPLADMANHTQDGPTFRDFFDESRGFELRLPSTALSRGQELHIKYGEVSNWELLLHYGFAVEDNPDDRVDIELEQSQTDDDFQVEVRRALLLELGQDVGLGVEHSLPSCRKGAEYEVPAELVGSLRLLLATPEELDGLTAASLEEKIAAPLSARCEGEVHAKLEQLLRGMLDAYPTSLEEDDRAISSGEGDPKERFAVIYRAGLKRIIHAALEWVERQKL